MIKGNASGAGKAITKLRACLMTLSISREQRFIDPEETWAAGGAGDSANTSKGSHEASASPVLSKAGRALLLYNNKLKKKHT